MATPKKIGQLIAPQQPALPLAPDEYSRQYGDQLNNILRLYFNQLSNVLQEIIVSNQIPFYNQVAQGLVPGYSSFSVFGYNPDVDQTEESVWPDGGMVPNPTSAAQLTVVSTSTSDDGSPAGVGAQTVYIEGVDGNYAVVSETITLNGTTGVTTTKSYLYINQFYVVTVGSSSANVGEITIKQGATLYDIIAVGSNSRTTGHYCVPAGYTAYLSTGIFSCGQASGTTAVTGYLKSRGPDNITRVLAVTTINNGTAQYDFVNPVRIPEKTCIEATAIGAANNNSTSSMFNILLVQN